MNKAKGWVPERRPGPPPLHPAELHRPEEGRHRLHPPGRIPVPGEDGSGGGRKFKGLCERLIGLLNELPKLNPPVPLPANPGHVLPPLGEPSPKWRCAAKFPADFFA